MKPFDYQEQLSDQGVALLSAYNAVYLAMEERTGKSLTAIRIAEKYKAKRVLIVTKAKAAKDWLDLPGKYATALQ